MARRPKPWFNARLKAWYVQLNGKQIRLHEKEKEANREFHRIMAAGGRLERRELSAMTVADACEAMLAGSQHLRATTLHNHEAKLGAIAGQFGSRKLESITPAEAINWVRNYVSTNKRRTIGDSTRSLLFRYVLQLFRWARDTGWIEINQFARTPNPWHIAKRDAVMTEAEFEAIMSTKADPAFKQVVEFIWVTGIRPGELAILSARHLDARMKAAKFQPSEHKTGTKTNLQRVVYFPEDLWGVLMRYADTYKQGPLIRKRNGTEWTAKQITHTFSRLKKQHGFTCVLYQARHRFATNMLERGVPSAQVASMLGHSGDASILQSTYWHPDARKMAADVNAAGVADTAQIGQIKAKIAAVRGEQKAEALNKKRHRKKMNQRRARQKKKSTGAGGT
jgi:integrase